jgi:hypothetical protein
VWLAFLTVAATAVWRVFRALYPPAPRQPYSYGPTVYGRPYPGQPSYPRPGNFRVTEPRYEAPIYDPSHDPTAEFPSPAASAAPVPAPPAGYGAGAPPYIPGPVTYPPVFAPPAQPGPTSAPPVAAGPEQATAPLPPVTGGTTNS